ncbi:MAG TPA: rhomboid family intramembrane serine protease [Pirellulaceae bacterium]|nr:rhomboid family intramembrane serine protease [Pirellulaceae bacterium]
MILLLPYGTDAPVYHWPYATVGTIAVNVVVFLFTYPMILFMEDQPALKPIVDFLILKFDMINPLQWLTWNYMHIGPIHLIVNMVALWAFGLIVEGKIGWWRFLLIYNAIGVFEGAIIQVVGNTLLGGDDGALGASGAIYGLMAISLIWAPFNQMQLFYWLFRWFGTVEGSVLTISGFFIGLQLVVQLIMLMHVGSGELGSEAAILTSELLHLVGAAAGLVVGVAMVALKWVDCEDYDVFSVIRGRHKMSQTEKAEEFAKSAEGQALRAKQLEQARDEYRQQVAAGQPLAALATHRRAKHQFPEWAVAEPDYVQLMALLMKLHLYDQLILAMLEYLKTYTERTAAVRIALAQVLTDHKQRPRQALAVLAKLNGAPLDAAQQKALEAARAKATAAFEQDPYEVAPEEW